MIHQPSKTFLEQLKEIAYRAGLTKQMPAEFAPTNFADTIIDPNVQPETKSQAGFIIGADRL